MNDPRTVALELWTRLISGERLDDGDLQMLIDLAQHDSSLQKEIEADATLHALLRSVADVPKTEDEFVKGVLERCDSLDNASQSAAERSRREKDIPPSSLTAHQVDEFSGTTAVNGTSTSVAATRFRNGSSTSRKRRQSSAWTATGLTAALFACLGLIVWTQLDRPSSPSGRDPAETVVQGPAPEQPVQPALEPANPDEPASTNEASPRSPSIVSVPDNTTQPGPTAAELDEPTPALRSPMKPDEQPEALANRPDESSQNPFATLTKIQDPVWERQSAVGDRIGSETVRLFAGSVELTFDEGAVVTLEGPVEFRPSSTDKLELRRGRLLASVPRKAIGFTVSTPTSNVVDLGTEFEVAVNDLGESDVQVLKGEVEVAPTNADDDELQKWRLLPSRFNQALFYARPQLQGTTPISTSLHGPRGQFQGYVSMNGQTAELTSPEAFDNVRHRVVTELARSQDNALKQWGEFVNSMQKSMQGTLNVNGQEMKFGSVQDIMRLQHQMLQNVQTAGSNSGESNFQGSINVNGKTMTFKTREEYEVARRAAFGPAATFGIGDVMGNGN